MTVGADHARLAYDALARSYDAFTAHHDHEAWTGVVLELAAEAGLRGKRLLDLGCGTGNSILPMLRRGFEVTGVDVSAEMLAVARRKLGGRARLIRADVRELPQLGSFDLVWALSDVVNYLLDERELATAFLRCRRNLAPDGVLAFDVDSLATFRALYSSLLVQQREDEVLVFEGRTRAIAPGGMGEAVLDRLTPAEQRPFWQRTRGLHAQRHHPPAVLRAALATAGLECVALVGADAEGRVHTPFDDLRHNKAVYIARIAAPTPEGR